MTFVAEPVTALEEQLDHLDNMFSQGYSRDYFIEIEKGANGGGTFTVYCLAAGNEAAPDQSQPLTEPLACGYAEAVVLHGLLVAEDCSSSAFPAEGAYGPVSSGIPAERLLRLAVEIAAAAKR